MSAPLRHFQAVPNRLLERYLCNELPPAAAAEVERAIAGDPELQAHVRERRAEQAAFKQLRPFAVILAQAPARPARRSWVGLAALGLASAAISTLAVTSPIQQKHRRPTRHRPLSTAPS